jgi:hypothetical protein
MMDKRKIEVLIKTLRGESGATLVEELVTIAIIGMGIVILVAMITTGVLGVRQVDDNVRADSLARSQLELIKDAPYQADPVSSPYPAVVGIPGYTVTIGLEYWNDTSGDFQTDPWDDGLQKITVTVSAGSSQTAQVSDFKVDR